MIPVSIADLYPAWHRDALCIGMEYTTFFGANEPDVRPMFTITEVRNAQIICAECPVAADCLRAALTGREEYGVWAGTTPRRRREILKLIDGGATTIEVVIQSFRRARDQHRDDRAS